MLVSISRVHIFTDKLHKPSSYWSTLHGNPHVEAKTIILGPKRRTKGPWSPVRRDLGRETKICWKCARKSLGRENYGENSMGKLWGKIWQTCGKTCAGNVQEMLWKHMEKMLELCRKSSGIEQKHVLF